MHSDVQDIRDKVQGVDDKMKAIGSEVKDISSDVGLVRVVDDKLDQANRSLFLYVTSQTDSSFTGESSVAQPIYICHSFSELVRQTVVELY